MREQLEQALQQFAALAPAIASLAPALQRLGDALWHSWQNGGKLLLAGNGGSAADAMHLAEELVVRFAANRRALPAIALCDPTVLTCAGNDLGFQRIFARQVEAYGRPGDVLLVLSTSGNSGNLLAAVDQARGVPMTTAALLGRDGGELRGRCDLELIVPCDNTARIQEAHKMLYHTLCAWVDERARGH